MKTDQQNGLIIVTSKLNHPEYESKKSRQKEMPFDIGNQQSPHRKTPKYKIYYHLDDLADKETLALNSTNNSNNANDTSSTIR